MKRWCRLKWQDHCSWVNVLVLWEMIKQLKRRGGWVLAFLWTHGMTLSIVVSLSICGCCLVTAHLLSYMPSTRDSLSECGSGWSNRAAMKAHCSVSPGSTVITCSGQCLARVMLLVVPELTKAGSSLSFFHCSHRRDYSVAGCSAKFRGAGIIFTRLCLCCA